MKARELAHEILSDVILKKDYANLSLKKRLTEVDPEDRALCTALVYTTLQHHRTVRALWSQQVARLPKAKVAIQLDLACTQLRYFERLPEYAIVDESVKWAHLHAPYAVGLINAVLRKVQLEPQQVLQGENEIDSFALNHALPTWVYQLWIAHYGLENAQKISKALLDPAHLSARINTLKISQEELLENPLYHVSPLSQYSVFSDENMVHSDEIQSGKLYIQDEASAYVAEFCNVQENMKVLDVCSAPGSKTAGLAMFMKNKGQITAVELHPVRALLVEELMEKLGVHIVNTKTADARFLNEELAKHRYDCVLADVPCSGLGVMRRKADIKFRLTPNQLDEILHLQEEILAGISDLCAVNGHLIYSTCTLNKKENEYQVRHFIDKHPMYELIAEKTIFPFNYGSDGFYMAKLKRVK